MDGETEEHWALMVKKMNFPADVKGVLEFSFPFCMTQT